MKAMLLREIISLKENPIPLSLEEISEPDIDKDEVLLHITRCGVCHTELDEIEGRTPPPHLPVVLGHQVVGIIEGGEKKGQRVGVAWIASACGHCDYCKSGRCRDRSVWSPRP